MRLNCGSFGHIFGMVAGIKLMPMILMLNKEAMTVQEYLAPPHFRFQTDSVMLAS